MTDSSGGDAAVIRRLKIERFRGIESLTWLPQPGLNLILGGGDVGKTTVLDAIGLLLSPTNTTVLTESDYWCRQVEHEFLIEAVLSLPAATGINQQTRMSWPWEWNGSSPQQPSPSQDSGQASGREPVYIVRARGTAELDLSYELIQPDESIDLFTTGLRRSIGLVRLAGDDRNDRDLRLVQGSALERLLADKSLRARLGLRFASSNPADALSEDAQAILKLLDNDFKTKALPSTLGLGLTGGQGFSIEALVGLTAVQRDTSLPLTSWGSGTRRLAALAIAGSTQGEYPITIVDEAERGLEPYRQRNLIKNLQASKSQAFMTTHSATVISSASGAAIWYLDISGNIGRLPSKKIEKQQARDPETFLARLTIVAEGAAEVGFVSCLLERALGQQPRECGIWTTDGFGHEATLDLLEALAQGGLKFGGFVDNENGRHPTRWSKVRNKLNNLLHRWQEGCLEENVIPQFHSDHLEALIKDPSGENTGERLRTLARRLDLAEKDFASIKAIAGDDLHDLIIGAATGTVPEDKLTADESTVKEFKSHQYRWFKSRKGGRELAEKMLALGAWSRLQDQLMPFLNAVRQAIGRQESPSLEP